jgi:hypothetical protein
MLNRDFFILFREGFFEEAKKTLWDFKKRVASRLFPCAEILFYF